MNLIQTLAIAIDADKHKKFTNRSAIKSEDYRHYYQLIRTFLKIYPEFLTVTTLNFIEEEHRFRIGVEVLEQDYDSVWLLTPYGFLQIFYIPEEEEFYLGEFLNDTIGKKRLDKSASLSEVHEIIGNDLYIGDTKFLNLRWENMIIATLVGEEGNPDLVLDKNNRRIDFMNGKASLSYIDAGEYGTNPGSNYTDFNGIMYKGLIEKPGCFVYKPEVTDTYWIQCPLIGRDNQKVGIIAGHLDAAEIRKIQSYSLYASIFLFTISFMFIIAVYIYFNRNILRPLRDILSKINSISKGSIDIRIDPVYTNEYNELGIHFNQMMDTIQGLTDIQKKFIPSQFIDLIGKKRLNDLKLGDNKEFDFSVLFSDIRGFTSIAENLSIKENFNFINSFLEKIGPSIRQEGGFIDKYIGDGIMAIFPNSPKHAILSAIHLQEAVYKFNKNNVNEKIGKISVGVGIHYGSIMMGIIGEEERYEATVLSDTVNLASRMEGLTKIYGCNIVVSGETIKHAGDLTGIPYRLIDVVRVKGKNKPVLVYEILAGYSQRIIDLKLSTQEDFSRGLETLRNKQFTESIGYFQKVLVKDSLDKVAEIHLEQAKFFLNSGIPDSWEGIRNLDFK